MEKIFIFTDPPSLPKVYGLYTHENVDIYGPPLSTFNIWSIYSLLIIFLCFILCSIYSMTIIFAVMVFFATLLVTTITALCGLNM